MSQGERVRVFLDSNVLTAGIVSTWGLDKAILSLCAARICRLVLAEAVREEVEENLLTRLGGKASGDVNSPGLTSLSLMKLNSLSLLLRP